MKSIENLRSQIAGFEQLRARLADERAEAERVRKGSVVAAAGGDIAAQKIAADARENVARIDARLSDISEAIEIARDELEAAEAEAERKATEAEHAAKLAAWQKGLKQRAAALGIAAKALVDLNDAFTQVDEISQRLRKIHSDIRVTKRAVGFEPLYQPYGLDETVQRWTACANGVGLDRFLGRLSIGAPNPPTDLIAADADAIAKLAIAERPEDAAWVAAPVSVPNRGDGFGGGAR